MKETEKNVSLRRLVYYFSVLLLTVCGLVFTLSSCEKDDLSDGDTALGPPVPVSINLMGISAGDAEDVTRSAVPFEPVTETVSLGDGLLMEMSLAADPAAELRDAAISPLVDGVKFVLIALNDEGKYAAHAEYTCGSGNFDPLELPEAGDYTFICVSFNSTTLSPADATYVGATLADDEEPEFTAIPNTVDLLYWTSGELAVSGPETLNVLFQHKFNSVKVKVDCSYNGWNISQINADSMLLKTYNAFTLDADGDVTAGTDTTTRTLSWLSILTANPIQESLGDTVYLSTLDIYLGAQALTLSTYGNAPSAATTAKFSSAAFTPGDAKSYVLTLKVKQPMFASSNIYWDADSARLTFDGYMDNPAGPPAQNRYQGVFFKFGSLVGISPTGSSTAATVYVPTYLPGDTLNSTWDGSKSISGSTFGTYGSIPYVSDGASSDRRNRCVSDLGTSEVTSYKGDICLYLEHTGAAPPSPRAGLHWRLPTSAEFGPTNAAWTSAPGWTRTASWTGSTSTADPSGRSGVITWGGLFGATGNFFPASGYRYANGTLYSTGDNGSYWGGSVRGADGYYLYFDSSLAYPGNYSYRQYGFAVRCVLQE